MTALDEVKIGGLGASRKRMIGALSGEAPADQRLAGSLALALKGAEQGTQILRVHDVAELRQALDVAAVLLARHGWRR